MIRLAALSLLLASAAAAQPAGFTLIPNPTQSGSTIRASDILFGDRVVWDGDRAFVGALHTKEISVFDLVGRDWQHYATFRDVPLRAFSVQNGVVAALTDPGLTSPEVVISRLSGRALDEEARLRTDGSIQSLLVHRGQVFAAARGAGFNHGEVYVFGQSGAGWSQVQRLRASDRHEAALFGTSLTASGDLLAVGAPGAPNEAGDRQGAVYLFRNTGGTWTEVARVTVPPERVPPPPSRESFSMARLAFGDGVAIAGNRLFVAMTWHGFVGSEDAVDVLVFERHGDRWDYVTTTGLAENDRDRRHLSPDLAAYGDCVATELVTVGRSHEAIYTFCADAQWAPSPIRLPGRQTGFGTSFDWGPRGLLVGAPYVSSSRSSRGAAYVVEGLWPEAPTAPAPTPTPVPAPSSDAIQVFVGGIEHPFGDPTFASNRLPVHIVVTNPGVVALRDVAINGTFAGHDLEIILYDYTTGASLDRDRNGRIDVVAPGEHALLYGFSAELSGPTQQGEVIVWVSSEAGAALDQDRVSVSAAWSQRAGPFRIDRDAYAFHNPSRLSWDEVIYELRSVASLLSLSFNPMAYRVLSNALQYTNGRCYGMAGTSGLYFLDPTSIPGAESVSQLELATPEVASRINRYFALQAASLGQRTPTFAEAFEALSVELGAGRPALLTYGPPSGGGHAVLAVQMATFERTGTTHVLSYDSNFVGADGVRGVAVALLNRQLSTFRLPLDTDVSGETVMNALPVRLSERDLRRLLEAP